MKTIIIDGIEYNLTPKVLFKKGDFVVIQETTYLISKIEGLNVTLSCNGRECLFDIDVLKNARLWDITKDAKDGDVLCYKDEISLYKHDIKNCTKQETTFGGFVYHCCYDGKRFITDSLYSLTEQDKMDIHPASKEQRDTLMKAMTDAGYTFDFESKELKKIEQKPADKYKEWYDFIRWFVKQRTDDYTLIPSDDDIHKWGDNILNHARKVLEQNTVEWSEEDEKCIRLSTDIIDSALRAGFCVQLDRDRCVDWLKSLRPQNHWKPTEAQLASLRIACDRKDRVGFELTQLLKELKKL